MVDGEDVDVAELLDRLVDDGLHGRPIAGVGGDAQTAATTLLHQSHGLVEVIARRSVVRGHFGDGCADIGDDDVGTFG